MTVAELTVPIIVLAGQSNANSAGIGISVFDQVKAEGGIFIHAAVNGSSLGPDSNPVHDDWNPNVGPDAGGYLTSLMDQISAMLDPASPSYVPGAYLEKVVWVQGEADALINTLAAAYQTNLTALRAAFVAKFGPHDMVLSALSDASIDAATVSDGRRALYAQVQQAQLAVAAGDPGVYLVDPDSVAADHGYTPGTMLVSDMVHYNVATGFAATLGLALVQAGSGINRPFAPGLGQSDITYVTGSLHNDRLGMAATGLGQAYGAAGTDRITLTGRSDGVMVMGNGMDAVSVTANGGAAFHLDLVAVEQLVLTSGKDCVAMAASLAMVDTGSGDDQVTGRILADMITLRGGRDIADGGGGDDTVMGGGGADSLAGGEGNDLMSGGKGDDQLFGGEGADTLSGGAGQDQLTGGAGPDVFVFTPDSGTDHITDFQDGMDLIALQDLHDTLIITGTATSAVVRVGDLTLVIDGVDYALITDADFSFG